MCNKGGWELRLIAAVFVTGAMPVNSITLLWFGVLQGIAERSPRFGWGRELLKCVITG